MKESMKKGKVYLVGGGPGDVGLLTLRAKALIEQADVVVYDKLVGQGVLALIPQGVELIAVGKVAGNHPVPQHEINEILLREALAGKKVVRLKGGDPFVFGRGGEELELLVEKGVPFEIVPGVTSAVAVPAYNGIPVTHRDFCSSLHIITGHTKNSAEAEVNYEALVGLEGTFIFLMGISAMPQICGGLLQAGMRPDMPAAVLERGTTAHQRRVVSDISHLVQAAKDADIKTPAIIVVGQVCTLEKDFHWAEDRPLGGLKVAVTRPKDRNSALADKLTDLGAEVVVLPTIETEALAEDRAFAEALGNLSLYTWIAFTSPAGVKVFYEELSRLSMDIRSLHGLKFAVIGEGTRKAVEEKGILTELMPEVYSGKALGELLAARLTEEKKAGLPVNLLLPRAKIGTEDVVKPLLEAGITFTDLPIYDTVYLPQNDMACYDETVDYVAFTSASTVRGFVKMNHEVNLAEVKAICIGELTAQEAKKYGMSVIVSEKATMDSMVDCFIAENKRCKAEGKEEQA